MTVITGRRNVTKYPMTTTAPSTANNIEKTSTVLKPDLGSGVSSAIRELDPRELSKAWPHTITLSDLLFERKSVSYHPAIVRRSIDWSASVLACRSLDNATPQPGRLRSS